MNVLKVWTAEYPWDVRVEKVSKTLTSAGHAVHLLARNRDRRAELEALQECVVHRLRPWSLLGRRLDAASQFPAFCNPRWLGHIDRMGREVGADLILCRDLPLAPAAIRAARRLRVPMVLDMAENYPAMIRDLWLTGATRFGDAVVRNPRAAEAVERWTVERSDHILVVVEESAERLAAMGVPPGKITVVSNTPSLSRLSEGWAPARSEIGSSSPTRHRRLSLVYLGLLEKARGVGIVLDAVAHCRAKGIALDLVLIGEGRARADFEAQAAALELSDSVHFRGYVPYAEALAAVARADVGLIPHFANESWNTTIPNKLFDYMAAGLPVLASDARPVRRVIDQTGCGLWFRSGDVGDLAAKLETLAGLDSLRHFGEAGRAAIREGMNWEADGSRLVTALEALV
jgi:glycosyltransferase involved in cell wall biosynthesis